MAKANEYRRCTVGYGIIAIDDVPIKKTILEAAYSGDSQAQAAIVKRFVGHLKDLGILPTGNTSPQFYFRDLVITQK